MLWNPGQLPEKWTLEKLLSKHESIPYNPDIANAFFRAGLIESWGRGIERIVETCQKEGYPIPEWKVEPNGVWVTFTFKEQESQQETVGKERFAVDYGRLRTITNDYERLSTDERTVLEYLLEHQKITRKQTVQILNVQQTKAYHVLDGLVEQEIIERHGQGRGTYYQLKDRG